MVFLRCSFENSIINRLAVKYLYSFTFVYGIWKQQIQETKLIFQLNVQCIFNVLFSYGLECNDMHLSINIIIWSKSYEDEQNWGKKERKKIYQCIINEGFSLLYGVPFLSFFVRYIIDINVFLTDKSSSGTI